MVQEKSLSTRKFELEKEVKASIREISDFPKPGILFKDITPILSNPNLTQQVLEAMVHTYQPLNLDAIVGVESRGFLFGILLAQKLHIPFIPVRKKGKLPYQTISESYNLEYGQATLELHTDAILPGQRILVHDDLLATGGTIEATCKLIHRMGGNIEACSFIINLQALEGEKKLLKYTNTIDYFANYQ
jgi:adenine phosphoribosyltransferase